MARGQPPRKEAQDCRELSFEGSGTGRRSLEGRRPRSPGGNSVTSILVSVMETPSRGGLLTTPGAARLALKNDLRPPFLKPAATDTVFCGDCSLFFWWGLEEVLGVPLKIYS